MSFGKLVSHVTALHIGVLKKYGYTSNMLDGSGKRGVSSIEVNDEKLLKEADIISALQAGVISHVLNDEVSETPTEEPKQETLTEADLSEEGKQLLETIKTETPTEEPKLFVENISEALQVSEPEQTPVEPEEDSEELQRLIDEAKQKLKSETSEELEQESPQDSEEDKTTSWESDLKDGVNKLKTKKNGKKSK